MYKRLHENAAVFLCPHHSYYHSSYISKASANPLEASTLFSRCLISISVIINAPVHPHFNFRYKHMRYWLMKSEPCEVGIDDALAAPNNTVAWTAAEKCCTSLNRKPRIGAMRVTDVLCLVQIICFICNSVLGAAA